MVGDLAVIGIRAAIEQQPGQFWMMSDARRTVERAFPSGLGWWFSSKKPVLGLAQASSRAVAAFRKPSV